MFDNIGRKIKGLAEVFTWIGILASVILGIITTASVGNPLPFFLISIIGSLISWISCMALYGFGELIENSASIEFYLTRIYNNTQKDSQSKSTETNKD